MKKSFYELYGSDFAETANDDELDALFNQLECIAPPTSIVESIMSAVSRLPLPQDGFDELDGEIAI